MVDVCTPAEMAKRIAGIQKGCEEGIRKGLVRACAVAETQAKKNLTPGSTPYRFAPFDTGLLRGKIGYKIEMESIEEWVAQIGIEANTEADNYGLYVHEGTRPHFAPMEAIQKWAERKSRGGSSFPWFPIWLKIAKEGTEPKPFLTDAIEATKDQYMPMIDEEYKKALVLYCARYG